MANRTIELTLKAQVGQLVAGLKTARDAVNATGRDVAGFVRNNERDMQTFGTALTTAGAGLTAMAVGAVKAAIDWESAWAGVQKTNDGTSEQMQRLEEDLRNLATTLPATHEEIAATAEMAGQLGVAVDDVAVFTETMVHLGETTNLSAEEAATALARFSNITGTSFADVDRLGSALVGLGNNFAATESEILHMSERIAAAGTQAGLSEGEIIGLATAMSAVGIEAEAGGTAMTMTFNNIDAAVRKGGDALEGWADLAGTTATEFADIWRNEPAQAVDLVVQGLAQVDAEGGSVAGTLSELGVNGIRQADVLRRLASASELAGDAMAMGNEEFEKNSALTEEAALRYETAAAQIQTAWNNIVDAAITAGSSLAPIVGDIAEGIGDLAGWFADLPEPVLGAATAFAGVAGPAAMAAGGMLLLAPRAVETWDAFRRLQKSTGTLPVMLRNVGKAAGVAAAGFAALAAIDQVVGDSLRHVSDMKAFETQLTLMGDGAKDASEGFDHLFNSQIDYFGGIKGHMTGMDAAIGNVTNKWDSYLSIQERLKGITPGLSSDLKLSADAISNMDEAMSGLVNSGNLDAAAAGFRDAVESGELHGKNIEDIAKLYPEYIGALEAMGAQQGYALEGTELYEAALGNLPPALQEIVGAADEAARQDQLVSALEEVGLAADGTVESLSDYLDMLFATGLAHMSSQEAQRQYTESLESFDETVQALTEEHGNLNDAIDETTGLFSTTTETGIALGREFDNIAKAGMDSATAMAEAGAGQEEVTESLQGTYDALVENARQFVDTDAEAEALARSVLGIEDEVDIETWMSEEAQNAVDTLTESLDNIPEGVSIITDMDESAREEAFATAEAIDLIPKYEKVDVAVSENGTAGQVQKKVDSVTGKTEYVFVEDDGTTTTVQQQIMNIDGVTRHVYVDDAGTVYITQEQIDGITDGSADVHVTESGVGNVQSRIDGIKGKTVTVGVKYQNVGGGQGMHNNVLRAAGGRAPRASVPTFSGGGRLPYTGRGTDQILGINSDGVPLAWVDDLEWIVNRRSSDKYDSVLDRINRDHPSVQHLAHLRDGGRAGREWSAASFAQPAINVTAPAAEMPTELTGKLYLDSGAFLGEVRMAVKDESVTRQMSNQLASQSNRDKRGRGVR